MEETNAWSSHDDGDGSEPERPAVATVLDAAGSEPFSGRSLLDPRRARVRVPGTIRPPTASEEQP
jgi:hypothetical protein